MSRRAGHFGRASRVGAIVALALVASGLTTVVLTAQPAQAARSGAPRPQQTPAVEVTADPGKATPKPQILPGSRATMARPTWPSASGRVTAGRGRAVVTGSPVSIGSPGRARPDLSVTVGRLATGTPGLALRISTDRDAKVTDSGIPISVDYSSFAEAAGGSWASRLHFSTRRRGKQTTLPTTFDPATKTVSTVLEPALLTNRTAVVSLAAAAGGPSGDFAATSLAPSASWQVGLQTGDFNWSYPMRIPPAVNGPAPQYTINYSSGSVDGRTAGANNQTSSIGEGFTIDNAYVERKFVACADDMDGTNAGQKTSDQCWRNDNASLVLAGHSSDLVNPAGTNEWHLKNADGSRIEHLTGGSNDDNNNEYWVLTTPEGTQYYFGKEKWQSGDAKDTNSTFTAPVFGNQPGEPCHAAAFADSHCQQAYRWNLDFVVDARNNLTTYFYNVETNRYGARSGAEDLTYDRGGYLTKIEYGARVGNRASDGPARILFGNKERCVVGSEPTFDCENDPLNATNASHWPDVPFDLICLAGNPCKPEQTSPAFFTRKRLDTITTQVLTSGGTYQAVDKYLLDQTYPLAGDGSGRSMRLETITHQGLVGGTMTLDPVVFQYTQLPNRVENYPDNLSAPPLLKYRLQSVTSEAGNVVSVNYSAPECTATNHPARTALDQNTMRCFPVWWAEPGAFEPNLHFFHKYLVNTVTSSDLSSSGAVDVVTKYTYSGNPAWHYDDGELNKPKHRTWSDWRGYGDVSQVTGTGTATSYKRYIYMRGMDGDRTGTDGVKRNVSVTGVRAPALSDHDRYSGFVREEITKLGSATGAEVSTTVNTPFLGPVIATDGTDSSRMMKSGTVQVFTPLAAGGVRQTKVVTDYDADGLTTTVDDVGEVGVATDNACTRTTYAKNRSAWILATPAKVTVTAADCGVAPTTEADYISETRNLYDDQAFGVAPTTGNVTTTQQLESWAPGNPAYVTKAQMTYDAYGRVTSTTDALGNLESTVYAPATGIPDSITTYSPNPASTLPADRWKSVQYVNRFWGSPDAEEDLNQRRTDYTYSPLGQMNAAWSTVDSKASGALPVVKFDYQISQTGRNIVTTHQLRNDGTYAANYTFYDGLLRPRQYQMPAADGSGGRLISDMEYDSRGLLTASKGPYYNTSPPSTTLVAPPGDNTIASITSTVYDGAGRAVTEQLREFNTVKWSTTTTYGGDRITTNPPGAAPTTTAVFDARDRMVNQIEYTGDASTTAIATNTSYTYWPAGDLKSVKDLAGNQWTMTYDLRGRMISNTDPDKGPSSFGYDDLDRQTTATNNGHTLTTDYDIQGRRTALKDGAQVLAEWAYDTIPGALGEMVSDKRYATDATGATGATSAYSTTVTGYDAAYRATGVDVTIPAGETGLAGTYHTGFTYNRDGTLASQSLPAAGDLTAETVNYRYDAFGQLDTVIGRATYVADTLYSPFGELSLRTMGAVLGKSVYDKRDYEQATRRPSLIQVSRQGFSTVPDLKLQYQYDAAGNITRLTDTGTAPGGTTSVNDVQCFAYDNLQQLTDAWTSASTTATACATKSAAGVAPYWHTWAYDPKTGNRTTETQRKTGSTVSATLTFGYTGSTSPHSPKTVTTDLAGTTADPVETFTYTGNGSLETRSKKTGTTINSTQTNTWDVFGQLTKSVDKAGNTASFVYDAGGNRLIRRDASGVTLYLGHTELKVVGATKSGTRYYSANGEAVALRTTATLRFLGSDHHGTASVQIDASTQGVTKRRSLPFGAARTAPNATPAWTGERGFVGGTNDASTGYVHLGAREYDPLLGRFISLDPVGDIHNPRQLQGYGYGNNNPLVFSDASGMFPIEEWGGPVGSTPPVSSSPPPPPEVMDAIAEYAAASIEYEAVKEQLIETAKDLGKILMDELGITAAFDCFSSGDKGACAETAFNVLTSLAGGVAGKVIAKYGIHWKRGYEVGKRVVNLIGDMLTGLMKWKHADEAVEAAGDRIDDAWEAAETGPQFFRGARGTDAPSFTPRPNEFKVDPETGLVRDTHGVSVFDNPDSVSSKGFTPHEINPSTIPDELRIIQRGQDPHHYEIVPQPGANLTPAQFGACLSRIECY